LEQPRSGPRADTDDGAWKELYEQNYLIAQRFLLSMGVQRDALEDVCQDVFLQAFRYLPKFRGECSFKTWLYRICASEARRHRQRVRLRKTITHLLMFQTENDAANSHEWGQAHAERVVQRALNQLPETERLVFVLYELEGLPGKEIAEIARCPEATVWRRLHYARKTFRKYVAKHGEGA
jgi:RNA polymerase sigma-70 factor (ECF subfamily)